MMLSMSISISPEEVLILILSSSLITGGSTWTIFDLGVSKLKTGAGASKLLLDEDDVDDVGKVCISFKDIRIESSRESVFVFSSSLFFFTILVILDNSALSFNLLNSLVKSIILLVSWGFSVGTVSVFFSRFGRLP